MISRYRYASPIYSFGGPLTPAIKWLIVVNGSVFLAQIVFEATRFLDFVALLGLQPIAITTHFAVWQFFTYQFLHGGFLHLFFNMLVLWMFGGDLERAWGRERFLKYYFVCALGAGLGSYFIQPTSRVITIGASGAVFGVLLAYGLVFSDRVVYLYFLFPVRAKYFVLIIGLLEFYSTLQATGTGISNIAHLSGMLVGGLYLKRGQIRLRERYWRWKQERLRKKFRIYEARFDRDQKTNRDDNLDHKGRWIQ